MKVNSAICCWFLLRKLHRTFAVKNQVKRKIIYVAMVKFISRNVILHFILSSSNMLYQLGYFL